MSFLMASLACSNFSGRAPRRRAGPAAPGFRGPAVDLGPGPTGISWLSSAGRLVLAGVSLEACRVFSSCSLAAHKTFVTSALQTSIHSRSQYPGIEEHLASDHPWFQRARPLPVQILRFDFRRYLKVLSLKHRFRSNDAWLCASLVCT